MNEIDWFELLICILFASFGGVVKKLVDVEKTKNKKKISVGQYISSSLISLFVGMIMYFIAKNYNMPIFLIMSLTSVTGFLGTPAIYIATDWLLKKFKKRIIEPNDEVK